MSTLKRIFLPGKETRNAVLLALTLGVIAIVASVLLLALAGWLITATALAGLGVIAMLDIFAPGAGIRAAAVGRTVSRYLERLIGHDATFRQLAELRMAAARGLLARPIAELERLRSGDTFNRLTRDIDQLDHFLPRLILPGGAALISGLLVVVAAAVVFTASVSLLLASILFGLGGGVLVIGALLSRRPGQRGSESAASMRSALADWLDGLAVLTSLNQARARSQSILQASRIRLDAQRQVRRIEAGMHGGLLLAVYLAFWLVLLVGIDAYSGERLGGPMMVGLALAVLALAESWLPLAGGVSFFESARRSALRVDELSSAQSQPGRRLSSSGAIDGSACPGASSLEACGLRFRYAPHLPELFNGLDIHMAAGQRLLVQGPSGCGKSTLGRVLAGILQPCGGQVSLGGVALDRVAPDHLRTSIGWMPQNLTLFHDTLAANLRLAAPDASDRRLIEVLKAVELSDWLDSLPEGLATWLGEQGKDVSGGQARRIALARMVLAEFPVLILDEPTQGLDQATAMAMWCNLETWWRPRTLVFLSHDAGLLPEVDQIIELGAPNVELHPRGVP